MLGFNFFFFLSKYFLLDVIVFNLLRLVDVLIVIGIIVMFCFFKSIILFLIFFGLLEDFLLFIIIRIFLVLGCFGFDLNSLLVFFKVFCKFGFLFGCWVEVILVLNMFRLVVFLLNLSFMFVFFLNIISL